MFPTHKTICGQFLLSNSRGGEKSPNKEWEVSDSTDTSPYASSPSEDKNLDSRELCYRAVHEVLSVGNCNLTWLTQEERKQQFNNQGKQGSKMIIITAEATEIFQTNYRTMMTSLANKVSTNK